MFVIVPRAIYPPESPRKRRKNPPIVMIGGFVVLVEMTGVEPVSENPFIQLSPGAAELLNLPREIAVRRAKSRGSPFLHGGVKDERAAHVHR